MNYESYRHSCWRAADLRDEGKTYAQIGEEMEMKPSEVKMLARSVFDHRLRGKIIEFVKDNPGCCNEEIWDRVCPRILFVQLLICTRTLSKERCILWDDGYHVGSPNYVRRRMR